MNVRELLEDLRIPYRGHGDSPHVSEGWVGLVCPWCDTGQGKYGLGINLRFGNASCWKCGPHGMADIVAAYTGRSWKEAKEIVGGLDRERRSRIDQPRGTFKPPAGAGKLLPPHRRYLIDRGFNPDDLVTMWGIGGIGPGYRLQWRIYIPYTHAGERVSWTTRAIGDRVPIPARYRSAKGNTEESVPRRTLLYGEDYCRHSVIVVEGHPDVWAGGPGFVATGGTGFSITQVRRIARYPVRVICFDNDRTAQRRARRLCRMLAGLPGETYRVSLTGKDASRSPRSEIRELRRRFLD